MIQPVDISLTDWSSSLLIDFPDDNVPILLNEDDWKEWGNSLLTCESFISNGTPSPNEYSDWNEWALNVYLASENS